jgi:hypothetical protein
VCLSVRTGVDGKSHRADRSAATRACATRRM